MSPRRRGRLRVWETHDYLGHEDYERSLEVLSRMRHGYTLSDAAWQVDIDPSEVRHYVGSAMEQDEDGYWEALPNDRLARRMRFLDERGPFPVEPANAREARKLSAYWRAVDRYLTTGDTRELGTFRRKRLRTRQKRSLRFLTDPHQLKRLGYAGELSIEDLYQH